MTRHRHFGTYVVTRTTKIVEVFRVHEQSAEEAREIVECGAVRNSELHSRNESVVSVKARRLTTVDRLST